MAFGALQRRTVDDMINRNRLSVLCAAVLVAGLPTRSDAWVAIAIGATPDNAEVSSAIVAGKPTERAARDGALEACRNASGDKAKSRCAVVGVFQNQCVAVAGSAWESATDETAAREQAIAKCLAAATPRGNPAPATLLACGAVKSRCDK